MNASLILLDLAGYVALMLWGLHMVQNGFIQAFGSDLRRILGIALRNRFKAFFAGLTVTTLLQSSTATGLMVSSFTASRLVGLVPAMAVMLGANVGSTLIVQIFSFDIARVAPIIVLLGIIAYKRSPRTRVRDVGSIIIGLGLMLLALKSITALLQPAEHSEAIRLLLQAISQDHLLDMIFAAIITWAMHSSVAMVIIAMSLGAQGLVPLDVAFALVLGANLGSAINPLVETPAGANPATRRLPFGNLINRSFGCLVALPLLAYTDHLPKEFTAFPAHAIASFHTAFNVLLVVIFFPILSPLARLLQHLLPDQAPTDLSEPLYLDAHSVTQPGIAISNAARETLRMADLVEKMLHATTDLLVHGDRKRIHEISQLDDVVDKLNLRIKNYITSLDSKSLSPEDSRRASEVLAFSMNIEHIGDIVSTGLVKLGSKKMERKVVFSAEGWKEISAMLERVISNVRLASSVFMSRELRAAKQLMNEKGIMRDLETKATETHFQRLREGRPESMETSNLHLDIVRDLKRINSHLTATAVHVLEENHQLLPSRMKAE